MSHLSQCGDCRGLPGVSALRKCHLGPRLLPHLVLCSTAHDLKQLSPPCPSAMVSLPESADHGLNPLQRWAKLNPFSFKLWIQWYKGLLISCWVEISLGLEIMFLLYAEYLVQGLAKVFYTRSASLCFQVCGCAVIEKWPQVAVQMNKSGFTYIPRASPGPLSASLGFSHISLLIFFPFPHHQRFG